MIEQDFAAWIETLVSATLGQDLWIGEVPSSLQTQDNVWWIVSDGGVPVNKNQTGERTKSYQYLIYRRGTNYKTVSQDLYSLEDTIHSQRCITLSDEYECIDIEATTLTVDEDLDLEDRKVGMLRATLTIYKEL